MCISPKGVFRGFLEVFEPQLFVRLFKQYCTLLTFFLGLGSLIVTVNQLRLRLVI